MQARPAESVESIDCLVAGGGWAGLAAAVELTHAGRHVTLIDAAPQFGGRARSLTLKHDGHVLQVDNGQHLLIGAYTATLALLQRIGIDSDERLARRALRLQSVDGLYLDAGALPGRAGLALGLMRARGLSLGERFAAARLLALLAPDTSQHWPQGLTVAQWLAMRGQPQALIDRLWAPVCVGTLNTNLQQACARTFARVLRDTFRAAPDAFDMLMARTALGAVLPEPAADWLVQNGASLRLTCALRAIGRSAEGRWQLQTDRGTYNARALVLAMPPRHSLRLLRGHLPEALLPQPEYFEPEPIGTVWLGWRESLELPDAMMLREDPGAQHPGQWLFNRRDAANEALRTVAGVVVSAGGQTMAAPADLSDQVVAQIGAQLNLPTPAFARAVIERQATYRCTPQRPIIDIDAVSRHIPDLALAGDWVWSSYPSTLESAVRSGVDAGHRLAAVKS
jgi:squalene-associated FAD-dependent desaturase